MLGRNEGIIKKGLFGMTALALGLGSVATANGANGIAEIVTSSSDPSASSGQQAAFNAMSNLCSTLGSSSLACQLTSGSAVNGPQLQNLSPQAAIQADTISITSPYKFIRSVNKQAQRLIDCDQDEVKKQRKPECKREKTTLANASGFGGASGSAYTFIGPFGISLNGGGGLGDRNDAHGQSGFRLDTRKANLMIDYSFNRNLIGGFSFGYLRAERSFSLAGGSLDSDSYRFAPFLVFRPSSNSYLTAMGGYALVNYNSTRSVSPFNGITVANATAKYDANQFFASLGGGYTLTFMDGWSLRGYGRGDYNFTNFDSFQESGGNATDGHSYAQKVNGQHVLSATSTIGAELSYAISTTSVVAVIIPKVRAEWVHEYKNNTRITNANFTQTSAGASAGAMAVGVAGPERNWANLGFGLQMLFSNAIVGYFNYDALLIQHASNHSITGGIRINF